MRIRQMLAILVHLPVGLWISSFIFDLMYFATRNPSLAAASFYCIAIGIAAAVIATPAEMREYLALPAQSRPKQLAGRLLALDSFIVSLFIANFLWRRALLNGSPDTVITGHLVFPGTLMFFLAISSYMSGLLAMEYGVGAGVQEAVEAAPDFKRAA